MKVNEHRGVNLKQNNVVSARQAAVNSKIVKTKPALNDPLKR